MSRPDAPTLDAAADAAVIEAIAALDAADEPVPATRFRALRDPNLRAAVSGRLTGIGRTLIRLTDDDGDTVGWTSGYDPAVARDLTANDRLTDADRAVLGMILLWTVAIPRAKGLIDSRDWTDAIPVSKDDLKKHRHGGGISGAQIDESVRRLRELGVLVRGRRAQIAPGPQFLRLAEAQSRQLWANLIIAADPDHPLARQLVDDPDALNLETP